MATKLKRSATGRAESTLLRYRDRNTRNGVTKATAQKLAELLGLTETDLLHRLLAQAAARELPQYEADDGPLSDAAWRALRKHAPREMGQSLGSLLD
jgi:hypothetical protein